MLEKKFSRLAGLFLLVVMSACTHVGAQTHHTSPIGVAIDGTDTATVKIALGKDGVPKVSVDPVILKPGQRLVFIGPTNYQIEFPDGSPFGQTKFSTDNAVINLELASQRKSSRRYDELKISQFKYNVTVEGKVLDPYIVLIED